MSCCHQILLLNKNDNVLGAVKIIKLTIKNEDQKNCTPMQNIALISSNCCTWPKS